MHTYISVHAREVSVMGRDRYNRNRRLAQVHQASQVRGAPLTNLVHHRRLHGKVACLLVRHYEGKLLHGQRVGTHSLFDVDVGFDRQFFHPNTIRMRQHDDAREKVEAQMQKTRPLAMATAQRKISVPVGVTVSVMIKISEISVLVRVTINVTVRVRTSEISLLIRFRVKGRIFPSV